MVLNKLIDKYKDEYTISYQDLKDAGESNRLNALVASSFFLLSEIINFILIFAFYYSNLQEHLHYIIYLCIYTPLNLFIFLYSRHIKKGSSYRLKTFQCYLLLFIGLSVSIFNLYFLDSPHNAVLVYYMSGFMFAFIFSISPVYFLVELIPAVIILAPGVYKNFGVLSVIDSFVVTIIMFSMALYKRYNEKRLLCFLQKQKKSLEAKTFGNFTLMYEEKIIGFSRSKSTELMAYLIYKNGTSVKTRELISVLYGDHGDSSKFGSSLRNLIVDIKHTLKELDIQNFFVAEYNNFRINPEIIKCDYYDFLAGDQATIRKFTGEFMSQYSWAEDVTGFLEQRVLGK